VLAVGAAVAMRLGHGGASATTGGALETKHAVVTGPKRIVVETSPPGAEVTRDNTPLGEAPVTLTFAPGDSPAALHFHLDGYTDVQRAVSFGDDPEVLVRLRPEPTPDKPPPEAEPAPAKPPEKNAEKTDKPEKVVVAPKSSTDEAPAASRKPKRAARKKSIDDDAGKDDILAPNF
jgi:outer membrane biosynthesis protein TonB